MRLEAKVVNDIFRICLYDDHEITDKKIVPEGAIMTKGITMTVGFHPDRLRDNKDKILELLKELPEPFMEKGGGGYSFLAACNDKEGRQWTGLHMTMEELFLLGSAVGGVRTCLPREMWPSLPGGVPYYVVLETPVEVEV